ncbi:unnamed protein product [Ascophyllum nodosum]
MSSSLEEEEITAQRDAAVSLFKGLQEKIRAEAESYEARTEAAEMARLETEIELEQLRLKANGIAMSARSYVRIVTQGWAIGVVLGWAAAFVVGCAFSPVLGFMLVLPFTSASVVGGMIYAELGNKMCKIRPRRRETVRHVRQVPATQVVGGDLGNKQEFLRQLQGRSDPMVLRRYSNSGTQADSFSRRVAKAAARALLKSAMDVTISAATSTLGLGGGGNRGARPRWRPRLHDE